MTIRAWHGAWVGAVLFLPSSLSAQRGVPGNRPEITFPVNLPPDDPKLIAMKKGALRLVGSMSTFTQQMIDQVFSFGEPGFQASQTAMPLLVVAGLAIAGTRAAAQCRGADSTGAPMIHKWKALMVTTDSATRQALSRNGVSQVDSSSVVFVTDPAICAKAMKAYNGVLGPGARPPSGAVYVIKVGTAYIVRDPVQRGGEFALEVVLDSRFRVKAQLLA